MRALATTLILVVAVGCRSSGEQRQTAWQVLVARVGPAGAISKQLALDGFATLVGPIPGGNPVGGEAGVASGSGAARWLLRHWDDLSDDQRVAATTALDAAIAGRPALRAADAARDGLQAFTDSVAAGFDAQEPGFSPGRVHVVTGDPPYEKLTLAITTAARDGEWITTGAADSCRIMYLPKSVQLFETMNAADADAGARRSAERVLTAVAAHELMHCHQIRLARTAERYRSLPAWIMEGSAAWGGFLYAYPSSPAHGSMPFWDDFFATPSRDVFDRAYDAIGFWNHAAKPWALLARAMTLPWEEGKDPYGPSATFLDAVRDEQGLAGWASSYVQQPSYGTRWYTIGPGLGGDEAPPPARDITLEAEARALDVPVRGFAYAGLHFGHAVDVVEFRWQADGAVHWSSDDRGPDDLFLGTGNETRWFCVRPDGCPCPDGTEAAWWVIVADRPYDGAFLAAFGIHDVGPNQPFRPAVRLFPHAFDDVVDDLCRPVPPEPPGGELIVCDTWFTAPELVSLLPGATRLASAFAPPVVSGPRAATLVSCFWDLQRNPRPAEPFFEWVVTLEAHLAARDDEPATAWARRLRNMPGCRRERLAGGIPACVAEGPAGAEVVLRIGSDRVLVLRTASTTTGGRSDYPTEALRRVTRQAAVAFAERLSRF